MAFHFSFEVIAALRAAELPCQVRREYAGQVSRQLVADETARANWIHTFRKHIPDRHARRYSIVPGRGMGDAVLPGAEIAEVFGDVDFSADPF